MKHASIRLVALATLAIAVTSVQASRMSMPPIADAAASTAMAVWADDTPPNWLVQVGHVARQDLRPQDQERIAALEKKLAELPADDAARARLERDLARERDTAEERRGFIVYGWRSAADAKGRDALAAAVSKPGDLSKGRVAQFRYDLACAHARLGAKDEAFAHLEQTLEADRASPIVGIQHWREDPDFASLKEDPRWKALLEKFPKADAPARE